MKMNLTYISYDELGLNITFHLLMSSNTGVRSFARPLAVLSLQIQAYSWLPSERAWKVSSDFEKVDPFKTNN